MPSIRITSKSRPGRSDASHRLMPAADSATKRPWELDDADKAEKLLRNLAQHLERDWSGVAGSILEGIDEILTVTRRALPKELRRSLACTNILRMS
jgi:putative transposase